MLLNEELNELYWDVFDKCSTIEEEMEAYKAITGDYADDLRELYCDNLLYAISSGFTKYEPTEFRKNALIQAFVRATGMLPKTCEYFHILRQYFMGDDRKCLGSLEVFLENLYQESKSSVTESEGFINEYLLVDWFFEPFKQAFPGFWKSFASILRKYPTQEGVPELCETIEKYYASKTNEEILEFLLVLLVKYPSLISVKELVGHTYFDMKMWRNAIAYFESVEGESLFFRKATLNFLLAFCYGKTKQHHLEEEYYRKAIELQPNNTDFINNLGYCLYLQKKYQEARECFERCLSLDEKYPFAANNYLRVLVALGRNKDAKELIKSGKYKFSKSLEKRVLKLENTNARLKQETPVEFILEHEELSNEEEPPVPSVYSGVKRQQFSNEKLLEDELTARIESGMEVFGLKLKMYKRKGLYGRQFIIPVGRLDLLCEDTKGDLYVIELKKDAGYDDAYKQTAEYLDWFEGSELAKGKHVYGIICVNSPTKALIEKVHGDKRMKIFEYQISYTEL